MLTFAMTVGMIFAQAADPVLFPVTLDDPILQNEEVFVSDHARSAMRADSGITIRCLEMPEGRTAHTFVCLTTSEWQEVFDRIGARQAQERAIGNAERFSLNRSTAITP